MLHVNFNTYNNYVTDTLYQWDINQDLIITGLGLDTNPEVHFSNANMDRAIVKQSELESDVVKVRIPNSILQTALTIKAYIGIYEANTFKVIETVEIPVIGRARPSDYVFEDTDGEIYSYKALENRVAIAEQCAVDSAESARQAEQASANAVSEALNRAILKSDIVEIVKVSELPSNPSDNVLYVIV